MDRNRVLLYKLNDYLNRYYIVRVTNDSQQTEVTNFLNEKFSFCIYINSFTFFKIITPYINILR